MSGDQSPSSSRDGKEEEESASHVSGELNGLVRHIIMGLQGGGNNWGDWTLPQRGEGGKSREQNSLMTQLNAYLGIMGVPLQAPLIKKGPPEEGKSAVPSDWTFPVPDSTPSEGAGWEDRDELGEVAPTSKQLAVKECWTPETTGGVTSTSATSGPTSAFRRPFHCTKDRHTALNIIQTPNIIQAGISSSSEKMRDILHNQRPLTTSSEYGGDTRSILSSHGSSSSMSDGDEGQCRHREERKRKCMDRCGRWTFFIFGLLIGSVLVALSLVFLELSGVDDRCNCPVAAGYIDSSAQNGNSAAAAIWEAKYRNQTKRIKELENEVAKERDKSKRKGKSFDGVNPNVPATKVPKGKEVDDVTTMNPKNGNWNSGGGNSDSNNGNFYSPTPPDLNSPTSPTGVNQGEMGSTSDVGVTTANSNSRDTELETTQTPNARGNDHETTQNSRGNKQRSTPNSLDNTRESTQNPNTGGNGHESTAKPETGRDTTPTPQSQIAIDRIHSPDNSTEIPRTHETRKDSDYTGSTSTVLGRDLLQEATPTTTTGSQVSDSNQYASMSPTAGSRIPMSPSPGSHVITSPSQRSQISESPSPGSTTGEGITNKNYYATEMDSSKDSFTVTQTVQNQNHEATNPGSLAPSTSEQYVRITPTPGKMPVEVSTGHEMAPTQNENGLTTEVHQDVVQTEYTRATESPQNRLQDNPAAESHLTFTTTGSNEVTRVYRSTVSSYSGEQMTTETTTELLLSTQRSQVPTKNVDSTITSGSNVELSEDSTTQRSIPPIDGNVEPLTTTSTPKPTKNGTMIRGQEAGQNQGTQGQTQGGNGAVEDKNQESQGQNQGGSGGQKGVTPAGQDIGSEDQQLGHGKGAGSGGPSAQGEVESSTESYNLTDLNTKELESIMEKAIIGAYEEGDGGGPRKKKRRKWWQVLIDAAKSLAKKISAPFK